MLGARQPEALRELPPEFLKPGDLVNGWRVVKKLGEGGCGCVFLVEQGDQRLAMKFTKARATPGDAAHLEARGLREVAYMLLAEHPHIMKVWGFGRAPDARTGWLYALLDYIEGDTLSSWARRNKPTPREVVRLFAKVASALEAAHRQGLFHRDVKPSNILVRAVDGEPVVADWGAGRYATAGELTEGLLPPGTARYRAPEARRFERENEGKTGARYEFKPQDDLFAVGATLYEVLTSRPVPEAGPRLRNLVPAHEVNANVPPVLGDVVRKLMALEPRHRHATAEALRRDLERLATQQGPEWDVPLGEAGADRDAVSSVPPLPVPRGHHPRWKLGALLLAGVALLAVVGAPWLGEGQELPAGGNLHPRRLDTPSSISCYRHHFPVSSVRAVSYALPLFHEGERPLVIHDSPPGPTRVRAEEVRARHDEEGARRECPLRVGLGLRWRPGPTGAGRMSPDGHQRDAG
jgi:serine/threonine-protein kinase